MSIESHADLQGLQQASFVACHTLDALEPHVVPGVTTDELDRRAAQVFAEYGGRSAPALEYGFPGTILISVNDEVVHGVPGPRVLEDGDLVTLDVTVDVEGYVADTARTLIVGRGSREARALRACASAAFEAALRVVRAGTPVNAIGREVERVVDGRGFRVIRELCGHGVGRRIHEAPTVPNYYNRRQRDVLTEGLVITIEPLICAGTGQVVLAADGWTIRTTDGSLAAHHEHTVVVTRDRPIVLTAHAA